MSLIANLTRSGSNWSGGIVGWFSGVLGSGFKGLYATTNLTRDGSNWAKGVGIVGWFKGIVGDGGVGLKTDLTRDGSNWKKGVGIGGWFKKIVGNGGVNLRTDLTRKDSNWRNGVGIGGWFRSIVGNGGVDLKTNLTNSGTNWAQGILKFLTGNTSGLITIALAIGGSAWNVIKTALHWLGVPGFAMGGAITAAGQILQFARGGALTGNHGTLFLAGEAGPEIVGHIGGRTEILNKSQIAQAIYAAVVAGMTRVINAIGINFREPLMASGSVMPYAVSAQIEKTGSDIMRTLDTNTDDMIAAMTGIAAQMAAQIVAAISAQGAGTTPGVGVNGVIEALNQRTRAMGVSPLLGV